MDCTGSMGPWIEAAKQHIQTLIYEARGQYPGATFEVGFVGYRDYGSDEPHITVDFTDAEELVRRIHTIYSKDGDDEAEDVAWGLYHASKLSWDNADMRIVYHIGDAPAHGEFFTQGLVSDRFPGGDPKHLDPRMIIKEWSERGYHYTFIRITHLTDGMIEHFHNAYIGDGTFHVIDLSRQGPNGFLEAMRESLTQHISTQDPEEE